VVIADYDPEWPRTFERERDLIVRACPAGTFVAIEHVGSTSVPGLAAKPVIDMMPGVRSLAAVTPGVIEAMASLGHAYAPEVEHDHADGPGTPHRRYFRKEVDGARAFHVHVVELGSDWWRDTLAFRDYLRAHPESAREYEALKRRLAAEFNAKFPEPAASIQLGYTVHKTDFVQGVLALAREEAAG
jgi:GrpB-like predicted nucleotidyltransferase (UPF0157 family)